MAERQSLLHLVAARTRAVCVSTPPEITEQHQGQTGIEFPIGKGVYAKKPSRTRVWRLTLAKSRERGRPVDCMMTRMLTGPWQTRYNRDLYRVSHERCVPANLAE